MRIIKKLYEKVRSIVGEKDPREELVKKLDEKKVEDIIGEYARQLTLFNSYLQDPLPTTTRDRIAEMYLAEVLPPEARDRIVRNYIRQIRELAKEIVGKNPIEMLKENPIEEPEEEKSVTCVVYQIDRNGNIVGGPIEVYNCAGIGRKGPPVEVKDEFGNRYYLYQLGVVFPWPPESKSLPGYYGDPTTVFVKVGKNDVRVRYHQYPSRPAFVRRPGKKGVEVMEDEEVIGPGEYIDIYLWSARESDREGDIPKVSYDAWIRIEARKLSEEPPNHTHQGLLRAVPQAVKQSLGQLIRKLYQ